jgi:hypothetical protein
VGDRERRLDSGEEGREGGLADAMVSGRGKEVAGRRDDESRKGSKSGGPQIIAVVVGEGCRVVMPRWMRLLC